MLPQYLKEPQDALNKGSLLMRSELMKLYQKSCSRMNFAARMSANLYKKYNALIFSLQNN